MLHRSGSAVAVTVLAATAQQCDRQPVTEAQWQATTRCVPRTGSMSRHDCVTSLAGHSRATGLLLQEANAIASASTATSGGPAQMTQRQ